MWLLQRKNIHKRNLLWLKIFGLCLSLHLILLFGIFCVYRGNMYMQTISINKRLDYSAPILFVPYPNKAQSKSMSTPVGKPVSASIVNKTAIKPIVTKATPTKIVPQKTTSAPAVVKKPTTITAPAKSIATKTEVKTIPVVEKKTDSSSFPKASSSAKATADKSADTPAVKAEVKKVEPPKPVPVDTKNNLKAEQKIEKETAQPTPALAKPLDIKQAVVPIEQPKEAPTIESVQPQTGKDVEYEVNNGAIVSNNYREVEALRRGAQLQKELVHKWHPPIGVSPDCTCEISFFVSNKGIIENLKMVKCSGVMMFDISARQALFAMKMPQWTYGNPLTISFKQ